jgi:Rad3-related DNA helicase
MMLSPADMGLPTKFKAWRPGQDTALAHLNACQKRFLIQVMPTGVGKSLLYMAGSLSRCVPTVILTSTRALQTQLVSDFSDIGLVEIKGRRNYRCIRGDGPTCDDGLCHYGGHCDYKESGCQYFDALRRAKRARYVVTNYAMWLTAGDFFREGRGCLVMDEAHAAPDHLHDHLSVTVDLRAISEAWCEEQTIPLDWVKWAYRLLALVNEQIEAGLMFPDMNLSRLRQLVRVRRTLESIVRIGASPLVVEEVKGKFIINPLTLTRYAEPCLFRGVPFVHMTSATVTEHTGRMLGIQGEDRELHEYPSPFALENRPVYVIPTSNVDRRMDHGAEMVWIARIDQIVGKHLDRKGIIHSVSYDRGWRIIKCSRHEKYMIIHSSEDAAMKVATFKARRPPAVLVSPAMTTGWDFPYELCQYQIIAKVPFPDSRALIMQERQKLDPELPYYMAWQTIVQAAGRGVRASDDWCETFIIDNHFQWLLSKYGHLAPKWFKESIRQVSAVPEPRR